ncbi:MAG: hypothetical protein J6Z22_09485 [Lachnospiraceae bacterium]|nr:hypothetical protein [Lachnospiraceae bacterium]
MEKITWFVESYIQKNLALVIVILAVLIVRLLMKRMPKKYVYCLWAIVGIRMLFSLQITSPISIYQFFPWAQARSESNLVEAVPISEEQGQEEVADVSEAVAVAQEPSEEAVQAIGSGFSDWNNIQVGEEILWVSEDLQETGGPQPEQLQEQHEDLELHSGAVEQEPSISQEAVVLDAEMISDDEASLPAAAQEKDSREVSGVLPALPFFLLWMLGALAVLGSGMISYLRVRKQVCKAVHAEGNLWECDGISTPFVLGILRPRIYVPFHLEEGQKNMVLAHERQHVRMLDPLARLLAYLLLAVYWMNPLVWLSYVCFVRDQEMRCDEEVISRLGADGKKEYGMTLLAFATEERFVGFSPVAFGESDAEKRIKNVLNYKKPAFWVIIAGIAIVICLGIICLTNAKQKQEPAEQTEVADPTGTEASQGEGTGQNEAQYHLTILADLDGDGEKESVNVTDYLRGQTTIQARLHGVDLKELQLKSVDMIKTQGEAVDLDGDGKEELILLQSSPMLASTYNWPGKVTILQVRDGEWRQLSDELFYPEEGEYAYREYCPKNISDQICVGVRIETMPEGKRLHLLYALTYEAAHGMQGILRLDCTYQALPKEGWQVKYIYTGHDYWEDVSSLQGMLDQTQMYGIALVDEVGETSGLEESIANKLFYSVPLQYFERNVEDGLGSSLSVSENGSFMGTDVKSGEGLSQARICEFTGMFTSARRVSGRSYLLTVDGLTYPEAENSYKVGDEQYLTMEPDAIANGDQFLLYVPGYPVAELPYKVIRALEDQGIPSWYNYELEKLPCYVLLNMNQGTTYLSYYVDEYVGQRMETVGLYGELSYPCASNGSFSDKTVTRLCADACAIFVHKVTYPSAASKSFSEIVRNDQLAEYLEYKATHFPHRFSEGASWLMETKALDYMTVDGKRVLHITCIPKYKYGSARGSWGTIHFLIDAEDGQYYVRDWYWDHPDSLDLVWRGGYFAEEAYDFWDHPVDYKKLLQRDAQQVGTSAVIFGLPVTCEETWSNPEVHTHYERRYYYGDVMVGKSFGYGESRDYVDDLDGDGVTELICYTREAEGQDYGDITVFRRIGNSIYMGRLTEYGSLELTNMDALSATRRITQHYDPDEHCLYLTYPVKGGDYNPVSFTYDDMKFTEYSYVAPQVNSWKEAYANYVRRSEYHAFSLIYLDDDEIPELYCQEGNYPQRIVSFQAGKLVERPLERNSFCYLEKRGIYYTSGGNMGEFPMEIVQLKDGGFTVLATGYQKSEYVANAESTAPDQMTEFIKYDWNGQSVTEEEYNQKIDAIIERSSTDQPQTLYSPEEILTLLGMEITSLAVG